MRWRRMNWVFLMGFLTADAYACLSIPPTVDGIYFDGSGMKQVGDEKRFNSWTVKLVSIQPAGEDKCSVVLSYEVFDDKKNLQGKIVDDESDWITIDGQCEDGERTRGFEASPPKEKPSDRGKLIAGGGCDGARVVLPPKQ